jgi:hypothetical protein
LSFQLHFYNTLFVSLTMPYSIDFVFVQEWSYHWFNKMCGFQWMDFNGISANPNLTTELVLQNIDCDWNHAILLRNNCVDIDVIIQRAPQTALGRKLAEFPFLHKYVEIPEYQNIDLQQLLNNPKLMMALCKEKYLCRDSPLHLLCKNSMHIMEIYDANPQINFNDKPHYIQFDFVSMSFNKSITLNFIEKNIDKQWSWGGLSCHPAITPEFVQKYRNKSWEPSSHTTHINFTLNDLFRIYGKFNVVDYCCNPNITFDELNEYLAINHDYSGWVHPSICCNPLTREKNTFIANKWLRLLLSTIYEFHVSPNTYKIGDIVTDIERVCADEFLVSLICKY